MKFLPLFLASLGRKKTRTTLTLGSFAVALFLYAILTAVQASFDAAVSAGGADRLVVMNRTSFIVPLPYAYRDRIARVPGVVTNGLGVWFGGVYQDPKNFFAQFAVDADEFFTVYPDIQTETPEQKEAFIAIEGDRTITLI